MLFISKIGSCICYLQFSLASSQIYQCQRNDQESCQFLIFCDLLMLQIIVKAIAILVHLHMVKPWVIIILDMKKF